MKRAVIVLKPAPLPSAACLAQLMDNSPLLDTRVDCAKLASGRLGFAADGFVTNGRRWEIHFMILGLAVADGNFTPDTVLHFWPVCLLADFLWTLATGCSRNMTAASRMGTSGWFHLAGTRCGNRFRLKLVFSVCPASPDWRWSSFTGLAAGTRFVQAPIRSFNSLVAKPSRTRSFVLPNSFFFCVEVLM